MENNKIKRSFDELGRIVIPKEIRSSLGIKEKDVVNVFIQNGNIVLEKSKEVVS